MMMKTAPPALAIPALVTLVSILSTACADPAGPAQRSREAQSAAIFEEVFRFEIQQFAARSPENARAAVCLAIVERAGAGPADPSADLMERFSGGSGVVPDSRCPASEALKVTAGPIDWVSATEVQVKATSRSATTALKAATYRVVWEADAWHCVGPILGYDPL